jgi:hypothetical protein
MSKKTLAVDSDIIDHALDELAEIILRTRKEPEKNEEGKYD